MKYPSSSSCDNASDVSLPGSPIDSSMHTIDMSSFTLISSVVMLFCDALTPPTPIVTITSNKVIKIISFKFIFFPFI